MVYWLVSSFVSATLQVLLDKLVDFRITGSEFDSKLEMMKGTLVTVQSLIDGAENRQVSGVWKAWLPRLENVAYDADDLIDEIGIEVSKLEGRHGKFKKQVDKLIFSFAKSTSASSLNDIQARLDRMLKELKSLCLTELAQGRHLDRMESILQTSSLTDQSPVFGRESDKRNIINMLVSAEESSRANNVSVITIIGMIGVGKTTLAQLVYNYDYQETMEYPFDKIMWVSVAKGFHIINLTKSIIREADRESTVNLSDLELQPLQVKLKDVLEGKKFLLVLDDLWNVNRNEWNVLLKPLKHGMKGSKIVVTTESQTVAKLMETAGSSYPLKILSDDDCWSVLKEAAQGDINLDTLPELNEIGKNIAKKCKGLSLLAKFLGDLLYSKVDENEWSNVLTSNFSVIRKEIFPALRSGYHRLPSHVRHCFAYCSMFPQCYAFEKDKIIRMWMGEGFIICDEERRMPEVIGSDYFDQLLGNSFFQIEGEKYMMHNAVYDFAQSVSQEKFLRMEKTDDPRIDINRRHISVACEKIQMETFKASYRCKSLRTFLLSGERGSTIKEVPPALFSELGRLRVLDLSGTSIDKLTANIGNLKHLRFLDLSNTPIKVLPETMHKLCLLQTLRLRNCSNLLRLPESTGRIKSLRHLELDGNSLMTFMPSGIGKLTGLQTINEFIVGRQGGQMKELKNMNSIHGSLCIKQLEKVNSLQEAEEANLAKKKFLEKLELQWTSADVARNDFNVLNKLAGPHESLKELTLKRYGGREFPEWVSNPLFYKLTSIYLYKCEFCDLLPSLGQLPKLKTLRIDGMNELKNVDDKFIGRIKGFQWLETLEFREMAMLEGWTGVRDKDMIRLRELTIVECPQMVTLPSLHYLRSLKKLEIGNCPQLPSLPEEGLSHSVVSLVITECPLLAERCKNDEGEDWMKIKHIGYVEIL